MSDIIFEHKFWLQVLGDHLRFFEKTLAASETTFLTRTETLKQKADSLLERARMNENPFDEIIVFTADIYDLKKDILAKHIAGTVSINLPPTFINHMLNELDEYIRILREFQETGEVKPASVLHHSYLWLLDADGHAYSIMNGLDPTEKEKKKEFKKMKKTFHVLWEKTVEYLGYLRTDLEAFPAIDVLVSKADMEMRVFIEMLGEIREMRLEKEILGTLEPLIADHMIREECYYLRKLAEAYPHLETTCDPTAPRIEG